MPINIPSSINVGGRFPDSAKYWVNSFEELNTGEIHVGLHRWIKEGPLKDKEYVLLSNGTWKEVSGGEQGQAGSIKIGKVTKGDIAKVTNVGTDNAAIFDIVLPSGDKGTVPIIDVGQVTIVNSNESPSVTNVGTADRAILNFKLPKGTVGTNGIDGQSIWMAFADDSNGTNPTFSAANKKFISFKQSGVQPLINQFTIWTRIDAKDGIDGKSVWTAYAQDQNGLGATFTPAPTTKFVSFYQAALKPSLGAFTDWQRFVGNDGKDGGPAGLSAYQTYVNNGNPNATESQFLASLKGSNGLSAYQIWLSLGNTGTEADFINSLGATGESVDLVAGANISLDTTSIPGKTIINSSSTTTDTVSLYYYLGEYPHTFTLPTNYKIISSVLMKRDIGQALVESIDYTIENDLVTLTDNTNPSGGDIWAVTLLTFTSTNTPTDPRPADQITTFSGDGVSLQYNIPHGLDSVPATYSVSPASADAAGIEYVSATDTFLEVHYSVSPLAGINNIQLSWTAY